MMSRPPLLWALGLVLPGLAALSFLQAAGADNLPAPRHGLAMHGTPKYDADFQHLDYVNPEAPKGGTVRLAATGTFDSLNPFILKGNSAIGLGLIYDSLLQRGNDEAFTLYGLVAKTLEVPEDRSWVIFTLDPRARFHDGRAVTADDVLFTFNSLTTKGIPIYRAYYAGVKDVRVLGPQRIRFDFHPGDNRELPLILGELAVMPRHDWETRDFEKTTLVPPLGSGPYRIADVTPGRSIVYEQLPDYWARDLPIQRGRYNFGRIRYDYYRDGTVALEAFKGGQYDFRAENVAKNWATGYQSPALRQGRILMEEVPDKTTQGMQGFAMNIRRPPFDNRVLRQAMAYAFDFEWTNRTLFHGAYTRTDSYFDVSELGSKGLPQGEEKEILERLSAQHPEAVPEEVFTTEYRPPSTGGRGGSRANLRQAYGLLRQAGYRIGRDGTTAPDGSAVAFELLLVQPSFERIALPYQENLRRLGIEMRLRTVDSSQYINRVQAFDFDMIVMSFGQSLSPGNEQRDYWTSDAAERPGSRNFIGIRNPAIDDAVELVIAAPDRESLVQRTRALDRLLLWGHYVVPQWHTPVNRIAFWDRFGRPESQPDYGVGFLDTWWVDPDKAARIDADRHR